MSELGEVLSGERQWCVITGDCLNVMAEMPDGCVDHVIADPPYSEQVHRCVRSSGRNAMPDAAEFGCRTRRSVGLRFEHLTDEVRTGASGQIGRLCLRWALVFSDVESCHLWRESLAAVGLNYKRTGEWRRLNGAPQFAGDRPASSFEAITMAHPKGRSRWNGGGRQACYSHPIVQNRGGHNPRLHTTQKPLPLMLELVALFTDSGDVILDPFCGSGTTLVAALRLGRRCIGIEKELKWADLSRERCEAEDNSVTIQAVRAGQIPLFGGDK